MVKNSEYFASINPVINSAKGSLDMLVKAEVPEAIEWQQMLRLEGTVNSSASNEKQELLLKAFSVIYELRYKSINYYAQKLKIKNIVDLGCGYSPRALYFSKIPGVNYIGVDLPGVTSGLKNINGKNYFKTLDITNKNALLNAIKGIEGRVLIITEGVLSYFTKSELSTIISNIRDLFNEYKGFWVTPDFQDADYAAAVLKGVFDESVYESLAQSLKQIHKTSVGTEFGEDIPAAFKYGMDIMNEKGFFMRSAPFLTEEIISSSMKNIPDEIKKRIVENFSNFNISAFYINSNEDLNKEKDEPVYESKDFSFVALPGTEVVTFKLSGRLDTVSSPELIAFYENFVPHDKKILVDCKELEYISSAGLRVFLIMYKKSNKNVTVINTNSIVDEVLDQTGFKELLCR